MKKPFIPYPSSPHLSSIIPILSSLLCFSLGRKRESKIDVSAGGHVEASRLGHVMSVLLPGRFDVVGVRAAGRERGRLELANRSGRSGLCSLDPDFRFGGNSDSDMGHRVDGRWHARIVGRGGLRERPLGLRRETSVTGVVDHAVRLKKRVIAIGIVE